MLCLLGGGQSHVLELDNRPVDKIKLGISPIWRPKEPIVNFKNTYFSKNKLYPPYATTLFHFSVQSVKFHQSTNVHGIKVNKHIFKPFVNFTQMIVDNAYKEVKGKFPIGVLIFK
ncbi:MAG: hypothetical protein R3250_03030 [Melioribacteraceae bacterium]|nr:hypothetical protein [Melioribacteraceae bacterium]